MRVGVCKRDRETVGGMCVYFLPGVSGDVCVCVCGRAGCGSIIRCVDPCAVFHLGALGSLSMCVLVGKRCVYMSILGVSKLLRWLRVDRRLLVN